MTIYEALQQNKMAFSLMCTDEYTNEEMQAKAKGMNETDNFEYINEGGKWSATGPVNHFYLNYTYRLRPDYTVEDEYELCEIKNQEGDLCWFNDDTNTWWALEQATHFPKFAGYLYEDGSISGASVRYSIGEKYRGLKELRAGKYKIYRPTHVAFKKG